MLIFLWQTVTINNFSPFSLAHSRRIVWKAKKKDPGQRIWKTLSSPGRRIQLNLMHVQHRVEASAPFTAVHSAVLKDKFMSWLTLGILFQFIFLLVFFFLGFFPSFFFFLSFFFPLLFFKNLFLLPLFSSYF